MNTLTPHTQEYIRVRIKQPCKGYMQIGAYPTVPHEVRSITSDVSTAYRDIRNEIRSAVRPMYTDLGAPFGEMSSGMDPDVPFEEGHSSGRSIMSVIEALRDSKGL
jgi:hypothetical protein